MKGKNRHFFEDKLVQNLKNYMNKNNFKFDKIVKRRGRIFIHTEEKHNLSKVMGVVSYSHALQCENKVEDMKNILMNLVSNYDDKVKFRVSVKRIDKKFNIKSNELEQKLGEFVFENSKAKVSLTKFNTEIGVEIYPEFTLIFDKKKKGIGGMPIGSSKKVFCYIESGNDLLAAFMMLKRGSDVTLLINGEIDTSWLMNYFDCTIKEIKNVSEIKKYTNLIVLGQNLSNFKVLTDLIEIRPLIHLSDKEIKTKIEELK